MADTNATALATAMSELSLTGATLVEEVDVHGESGDGEECSGSEGGDDKPVIEGEAEITTDTQRFTLDPATERALSSPVRLVIICPEEIVSVVPNTNMCWRINSSQLEKLAQVDTQCLLYYTTDPKFGQLVVAAHSGNLDLIAAVKAAGGLRDVPLLNLTAHFCSAERAVHALGTALINNGFDYEKVPVEQWNSLVDDIAQHTHKLVKSVAGSVDNVAAILGFTKSSYLEICQREVGSDEYKRAVEGFSSGVGTMMLCFRLTKDDYTHHLHSNDPMPEATLGWKALAQAIYKVKLAGALGQRGTTTDAKDPKKMHHDSYQFFVRLTEYVSFLGLVENHIGWETIPAWLSYVSVFDRNSAARLITPVIQKFRTAITIPGLANGTGAQVVAVPYGAQLRISNRVWVTSAIPRPATAGPSSQQPGEASEGGSKEVSQEDPKEVSQEDPKEVSQEDPKEAPQGDSKEASDETSEAQGTQDTLADEQN